MHKTLSTAQMFTVSEQDPSRIHHTDNDSEQTQTMSTRAGKARLVEVGCDQVSFSPT